MPLRIVIWNCSMALHSKLEPLMSLNPDIAIIPECATPEIVKKKQPVFYYSDAAWIGLSKHKGLAPCATCPAISSRRSRRSSRPTSGAARSANSAGKMCRKIGSVLSVGLVNPISRWSKSEATQLAQYFVKTQF